MKKLLLPLLAAALLPAASHAADAAVVSSYEHAILYTADGSVRGDFKNTSWEHGYGLNGGDYTIKLFNGDFEDYCHLWEAGCYIVVDLTSDLASGYYVTDVKIGHRGNTKYSIYYSEDGSSWTPVVEESDLGGVRTYSVEHIAKKIKYVWNTVINYTTSLAEIEVWGIDPAELECSHPEEYLTEWEAVPGTANCTEYGIDQRECTNCGTVFHRESPTMVPTGHNYETILVERGTSLTFGSGTNVCTRCGYEVAFPEPRDLVSLGGFKTAGVVRFTDVSLSSFYASWSGIPTTAILDNDWTYGWSKFWAASSKDHDTVYIDYEFGTAIDLTAVDISVHNHDQIVEFYSLVGEEEILIGSQGVEKDSSTDAPEYQRLTVDFRGVTLSTLRVRFLDSIGMNVGGWNNYVITCSECHPYGTVEGAGKTAAVRTRIIID